MYQELQKRVGSSSQNYIIAARVTQGHDDWQNASAEEKQEIIRKWNILKADLKKKKNPGKEQLDQMHAFVSEHKERKRSWQDRRKAKKSGSIPQIKTPTESQESIVTGGLPTDPVAPVELPASERGQTIAEEEDEKAERAELEEAIRKSVTETSRGDPEQDETIERAIRASLAELDRERASAEETDEDAMKRAMKASLEEVHRFADSSDQPEIPEQDLEEAIRRSVSESKSIHARHNHVPPPSYDDATTESALDAEREAAVSREYEQAEEDELRKAMDASKAAHSEQEERNAAAAREYEQAEEDEIQKAIDASRAAHEEHGDEMTRQKTEEEIVMEYVKKQSLAEQQHRQDMLAKGKGRMTEEDDTTHDEELRRAIAMSKHREGEEGESSGA